VRCINHKYRDLRDYVATYNRDSWETRYRCNEINFRKKLLSAKCFHLAEGIYRLVLKILSTIPAYTDYSVATDRILPDRRCRTRNTLRIGDVGGGLVLRHLVARQLSL